MKNQNFDGQFQLPFDQENIIYSSDDNIDRKTVPNALIYDNNFNNNYDFIKPIKNKDYNFKYNNNDDEFKEDDVLKLIKEHRQKLNDIKEIKFEEMSYNNNLNNLDNYKTEFLNYSTPLNQNLNYQNNHSISNLINFNDNNINKNNTSNKNHNPILFKSQKQAITSLNEGNNYLKNLEDTNMKFLEYKLENKKLKIKNLKTNIDLLTKENSNLKTYVKDLEKKINNINIESKKELINENDKIEKDQIYVNKLKELKNEIKLKNDEIEKLKKIDELRMHDIELLNQKSKDLELIADETNNEQNNKINKLITEKKDIQTKIDNVDKILGTVNYFIKKMYNILPQLKIQNQDILSQSINEPSLIQKHLIEIENSINDLVFSKLGYNNINNILNTNTNIAKTENSNNNNDLEKKIMEIKEENEILQQELKSKTKELFHKNISNTNKKSVIKKINKNKDGKDKKRTKSSKK